MIQNQQETQMLSRRPIQSDNGPAMREPTMEPAARAEPMAPCTAPWGLSKYLMYCGVPIMALIDEMSKPNLSRSVEATKQEVRRANLQHATHGGDKGHEVDIVHLG